MDSSASVVVTCTPTYLLLACTTPCTHSLSNGVPAGSYVDQVVLSITY